MALANFICSVRPRTLSLIGPTFHITDMRQPFILLTGANLSYYWQSATFILLTGAYLSYYWQTGANLSYYWQAPTFLLPVGRHQSFFYHWQAPTFHITLNKLLAFFFQHCGPLEQRIFFSREFCRWCPCATSLLCVDPARPLCGDPARPLCDPARHVPGAGGGWRPLLLPAGHAEGGGGRRGGGGGGEDIPGGDTALPLQAALSQLREREAEVSSKGTRSLFGSGREREA